MRVVIVAHGHPALSAGGAEIASYQLFKALQAVAGITAFFVAANGEVAPDAPDAFGPFRERADEFLFHAPAFDRFLFSQPSHHVREQFSALLHRLRPDVVHFHHYLNVGLELIALTRRVLPRAAILLTLHEYLAMCHHYGVMVQTGSFALCRSAEPLACSRCFPSIGPARFLHRQRFVKAHFDLVNLLIAPSEFLRQRYISWGVAAERIVVVENGISPGAPPGPRPRQAGESRARFGFFGQVHPFKGLLELLAAFEGLKRLPAARTKAIRLSIHGAYLELNSPDYIELFRRRLAAAAPLVAFHGAYDSADLPGLMAAIDWVIVPSIWWENSPLVIQEAFAHRRPVLCSDIGGMAEKVRPGLDGFWFPAGSSAALAELVLKVAEDPEIWERLQATLAQPCKVDQSVGHHIALYRSVRGVPDGYPKGARQPT